MNASKPLDLIEVMAQAIAERRCARDQHRAVQSGCDILLAIDLYLVSAREDAIAALAALEKEGHVVVPRELVSRVIDHAYDGQRCIYSEYNTDDDDHAETKAAEADIDALYEKIKPAAGISRPQAVYTPEPRKEES